MYQDTTESDTETTLYDDMQPKAQGDYIYKDINHGPRNGTKVQNAVAAKKITPRSPSGKTAADVIPPAPSRKRCPNVSAKAATVGKAF